MVGDAEAEAGRIRGGGAPLALAALAGLGGGILLAVATHALSLSNIGGANWSLRGNGALVVPFAGGPALLAGGWTALGLWRLRAPGWMRLGLAGGAGALVLALGVVGGPILAPEAVMRALGPAFPPLVAVVAAALGLALGCWLATRETRLTRGGVVIGLAAGLVAVLVALPLYPLTLALLPLAVAGPSLAARSPAGGGPRAGRLWLIVGALALLAMLVAGLVAGARLAVGLLPM
jgi:hypothetical protein